MSINLGEIRNHQGEKLDYTLHEAAEETNKIVVIGHGVTGNKDRPLVVALAQALAEHGIHALRFSFSGNGNSEGKFTDSCISKEIEDLGCVLDALVDFEITYAGHSMGGAVGVIRTANDHRIKKLISLAGMVHTREFAEREFGAETPDKGFMWENQECPLSSVYVNDMATIETVTNHASQVQVPWLLIHGSEDDVVPLKDSLDILPHANDSVKLFKIEGADHVFDGSATDTMCQIAVDWLIS
jgi:alpha/beta superfamily hydrolase